MTEQNHMNGTNAEDNGQAAAQDGTTVSPSTDQSDPSDGAGDRGEESLKEELTRLEIKLEEMEAALAASREETLRALADMQNLRRRTAREVQQARDFAVEGFARDLLNVSDNMERALNAIPDSQEVGLKALAEGIRLVQTELKRVFGNHGVTRIETVGQTFDPNLHQAVQQVVAPGVVPGSVVSELQSGFLLNGRLLRASMVVVAKDGE